MTITFASRSLPVLLLFAAWLIAPPVHATVYKCLDAAGKVTYTNLSCDKSGLKEDKVILAPSSPAESVPVKPARAVQITPVDKQSVKPEKSGTIIQLMKSQKVDNRKCDQINESLGKIMDEMDAARYQGYTSKQEAEWNNQLKRLQAEKNKLGCF